MRHGDTEQSEPDGEFLARLKELGAFKTERLVGNLRIMSWPKGRYKPDHRRRLAPGPTLPPRGEQAWRAGARDRRYGCEQEGRRSGC